MKITDVKGTVSLSNGVEMPYFGLGVFKSQNGKEVTDAIIHAIDNGYRLIDTAAIYNNEDGVGQAVKKSGIEREDIWITSKVWNTKQGYDKTIKAFYGSLERLECDYLDLYLVHWPIKDKFQDTYRALETLYEEGKIRAIGVSNFSECHLDKLMQTAKISPMVNQIEYHPRFTQKKIVEKSNSMGIQVQAWSPLMRGGIFEITDLQKIANKYNKNLPQLVLRWNLQNGIATIPKSVNFSRIVGNSQIFDFEISAEDMKLIDNLNRDMRIDNIPDDVECE